jgi:hypothetical protein
MYFFCTYFDRNYLSRGLALYHSLKEHCPAFKLWVLCMDKTTFETLEKFNIPDLHPINLEQFEINDKPLQDAKQNRSRIEYYFTCTPSLPLFILNHHPEVDIITYLDADLFFFADPAPLFAEMDGKSIGIIDHRFPARLKDNEKYGLYNVGWLSFRKDKTGVECLNCWRKLCLEWCYDRVEGEQFADQKYLDHFPERYGREIILQHKGANVAPWNIENYNLNIKETSVYVDDQPLLFFHFQGFNQVISCVYDWGLWTYGVKMSQCLLDYIYIPYIHALQETSLNKIILKTIRHDSGQKQIVTHHKSITQRWLNFFQSIFSGKYSFVVKGKVITFF